MQSSISEPLPEREFHPPIPEHIGRLLLVAACAALTCSIVGYLHPTSILGYAYFLLLWTLFITLFDRHELPLFFPAYFVNALLTSLYFAVQIYNYPETHGTTSPHGYQTDDSYFFSLIADEIPAGLQTRDLFYRYQEGFSTFIRFLTPFRVVHPLDVIFFTSGVAGMLCVYTHQYARLITSDPRVARTAYLLCLLCPFLLMNGGAVLVRDTFIAGLVMLSLCCIYRRLYLGFLACIVLHLYLRPATGLLILPVLAALHISEIAHAFRDSDARKRLLFLLFFLVLFSSAAYAFFIEDIRILLQEKTVDLTQMTRSVTVNDPSPSGRGAFLWVQQLPGLQRLLLATIYMFLTPFLTWTVQPTEGFDLRILLVSVIYPLYIFWVHAVALAGLISKHPHLQKAWVIFGSFLVGCFLIGVYSTQSRHKTIIQPLYYVLAGIGWHWADPVARKVGAILSVVWLLVQIFYSL